MGFILVKGPISTIKVCSPRSFPQNGRVETNIVAQEYRKSFLSSDRKHRT